MRGAARDSMRTNIPMKRIIVITIITRPARMAVLQHDMKYWTRFTLVESVSSEKFVFVRPVVIGIEFLRHPSNPTLAPRLPFLQQCKSLTQVSRYSSSTHATSLHRADYMNGYADLRVVYAISAGRIQRLPSKLRRVFHRRNRSPKSLKLLENIG